LFLFIFESIGTSELIFIGIIALIFLGPRRMPEMARKLGKIMNDLRSTTSEFRQTWEREVNFEEEAKALREGFDPLDEEPVARETVNEQPVVPEIKQIDKDAFDAAGLEAVETSNGSMADAIETEDPETDPLADKSTWL
jgi:sec-independent protein translocase protein TatB